MDIKKIIEVAEKISENKELLVQFKKDPAKAADALGALKKLF